MAKNEQPLQGNLFGESASTETSTQSPEAQLWARVQEQKPKEHERIKSLLEQGYEEQQIARELILSLGDFGALADFVTFRAGQFELREDVEHREPFALGRTICQLADGRRVWATREDSSLATAMTTEEFCGQKAHRSAEGLLTPN